MIKVINNNTKLNFDYIEYVYDTVIMFFKSVDDRRGNMLYSEFMTMAKQYAEDSSILFLVIIMDDEVGRKFAAKRNVSIVPVILKYVNKLLVSNIGCIPLDIENQFSLRSNISKIFVLGDNR